ncbi:TRAP transporter small permease subunit [Aurantimonas sp. VKM B-3413]|uniref:TRAP transporter small permease subunit n=1 Tax=Aurantimonas sp. VKM B-3413 TaxID=2779401 RepID=UPI001E375118|nr:TRAP transporter small permease subunit [Aurantimonas sp. VKM B-3413]MCB8838212.1 TRAP transporter small permease subunit [Aurantimonas sp. VKM B-3413]
MPSLTFVLPHWLYWAMLVVFPIVAMVMARRGRRPTPGNRRLYSLPLAYFVLITGGMLGLHRFYLKSLWGLLYLPLFFAILFANAHQRTAREAFSDASNIVRVSQSTIERETARAEDDAAQLASLREDLAAAEEGSFAKRSVELRLKRQERRMESSQQRIAQAEADLRDKQVVADSSGADRRYWEVFAFVCFLAILAFMALDAVLMPMMVRRANARIDDRADPADEAVDAVEQSEFEKDRSHVARGWSGWIDALSFYSGEFVSYWSVIAVFVYYYEVVARYVFNSPTNWAHEGMYLMFGMQYLISGAYAMLCESHVRVDVFYAPLSPRRKAMADILTSVFFFIFAGVLLATGWIFAADATRVNEVSFTEWQLAYWPFKWAIVVGAALIVLQGVAKLAQDFRVLATGVPHTAREA